MPKLDPDIAELPKLDPDIAELLKLDPDIAEHVTSTGSPELSVAVSASHSTSAVGFPEIVSLVLLAGQLLNTGGSLSARFDERMDWRKKLPSQIGPSWFVCPNKKMKKRVGRPITFLIWFKAK